MYLRFRIGPAAIMISFLVGCAGEPRRPTSAASTPAPKEAETAAGTMTLAPAVAAQLSFSFAPYESDEIGRRASHELLGGLAGAGFRFAPGGSADTDARFEVRVAPDEDTSRPKVSLVLARGDDVIEWATAVVSDDSTLDEALRPLVARMCDSTRVASLAKTVVDDRERAARIRTIPTLAPKSDAVPSLANEVALTDVALRRCRNARSADACAPVLAYLRDHPNGARAPQAEAAWKLASARLQRRAEATPVE